MRGLSPTSPENVVAWDLELNLGRRDVGDRGAMVFAVPGSRKSGLATKMRTTKEDEMKFFLDTANLNEIREGTALGLVDGVTTNPSLVAKEGGVDFKQHVAAICELVKGDVSAEVTSLDTEGMLREGREYAAIAPNVVVKCPLTPDGLKATRS